MVYDTSCDHETRVDGATNDPSKGIPSSVIKPVVEIIESFLSQVLSCTVVKVRIKLMNNRFKPRIKLCYNSDNY